MEAQINASGASGGGQNAAPIDIQNIRLNPNLWITRAQLLNIFPMGRRPFAVEQSSSGEHENAGANRNQPRSSRVSALKSGDQLLGYGLSGFPSGNDDGAGTCEMGNSARSFHGHASG